MIRKATISMMDLYDVDCYIVTTDELTGFEIEIPMFTIEQAQQIIENQRKLVDEYDNGVPESYALVEYDANTDGFIETYGEDDCFWCVANEVSEMPNVKLYAIGQDWPWRW